MRKQFGVNAFVSAAATLAILTTLSAPSTPATAAPANSGTDVNALISDALVLLRANRNEEAAAELKQAIAIQPRSAEAHHNYGLALAKLGDMPGAIEQLKQATQLKPQLDASWLTLGGLQQSAGRINDAIATYSEFKTRFGDRTDLNDTLSKVDKLLEGLRGEAQRAQTYKDGTDALQSRPQSLLQTTAQTAADDYLAEAVKNGVVRWSASSMPIRVYIHDAGAVSGFKPQWQETLMRSFTDWSTASHGLVRFKFIKGQPPEEEPDLDCFFVQNPPADSNLGEAEAGQARMQLYTAGDRTGTIKKGTITLLTKSMSPVLPLTDNRMRVTCLHEIGHALGLAGHTTNPEDIMFYSTSFKDEWRNLSGRDARTIQRLYAGN
jgi:predicted Zn-dependent protease/Tfp pilus assembly protein PilF